MSDPPNERRSTHTIRFSETEWRTVLDLAESAGIRPTVFVRRSAIGQRLRRRPKAVDGAAIRAMVDRDRQLARIGNNLNQLVRLAHGGRLRHGKDFRDVLGRVLDQLEASRAEILDLADDLRSDRETRG